MKQEHSVSASYSAQSGDQSLISVGQPYTTCTHWAPTVSMCEQGAPFSTIIGGAVLWSIFQPARSDWAMMISSVATFNRPKLGGWDVSCKRREVTNAFMMGRSCPSR